MELAWPTASSVDLSVEALRNLTLAVPLLLTAAATVARYLRDTLAGRVPAAALATLWSFVAVLAVESVQPWWRFADSSASFFSMPVETALGWALLWGALPVLAGGRWWLWWIGFAWVDLQAMPALSPLLHLSPGWQWGEALLLVVAAGPALLLGHATRTRTLLGLRVAGQAALFVGLFGWLVPALVLPLESLGWRDVVAHSYLTRSALLAATVIVAVPALSAVLELARAGGTPFPWDPPKRLVTTGPYAFLANPMQVGATALTGLLALAAGSLWMGAASLFSLVFSVVLAERHEHTALATRWPEYLEYRRHVRTWIPRWRAYVPTRNRLLVSHDCALCDATGSALALLGPENLTFSPAEEEPTPPTRMTWVDPHGHESGVAAFARALEQTTWPMAWLGWCIRLPGMVHLLQLLADTFGLGPRDLTTSPRPATPSPGGNR